MRSASLTAVRRLLRWIPGRSSAIALAAVACTLALAAALSNDASASYASTWVAKGDVPLPAWVKSARVLRADEPIVATPSKSGKKRGAAGREARLPVFGARSGPGCAGRYLNVGPYAWICDEALELSGNEPVRAGLHTFADPKDGLPFRYYFVGPDGSSAYRRLDAVDVGDPQMQLDPGFAVAIIEEKTFEGSLYGRTSHNLWVPMRDLGPSHPSGFKGEQLTVIEPSRPLTAATATVTTATSPATTAATTTAATTSATATTAATTSATATTTTASAPAATTSAPDPSGRAVTTALGPMPFAWVLPDKARVRKTAGGVYTSESRARFEVVPVLEEAPGGKFVRVGPSAWLAASDVRRPSVSEPPKEVSVASGEKWIDVELATQTLVAYEGKKPVFATLVTTGKGRAGTANATPTGVNRIWIKLLATDMDNLEDENASRYYRMESVPYVQFFSKGVALHAAYWHRSFGNVRSHGCVNLSPLDAQRLFWWTGPRLPAGWTAALPMPHELGTVIRVR